MIKNIILDFMDPENRILYGTYKNYEKEEHYKLLSQSLNFAVLLCGEYCILPPCAIMQCECVRFALYEKSKFLEEGLIKFPVREKTLQDFIEKKKVNYIKDKNDENYVQFFDSGGPEFLIKHKTGIIKRETKMGEAVAYMVQAMPFTDKLWSGLCSKFNVEQLEEIQNAPLCLIQNNEAISVTAIKRLLSFKCDDDDEFQIGRILQNKYFNIYLSEYDSEIIHDIPPKTTDFYMKRNNISYEFSFIKFVFKILGIYDYILNATDENIINLRLIPEYFDFIETFFEIGNNISNINDARRLITTIARDIDKQLILDIKNFRLNDEATNIDKISQIFGSFSNAYNSYFKYNYKAKSSNHNSYLIEQMKIKLKKCDCNKPYVFIGYNRKDSEELVYNDCLLLGEMGINYWIDNANMQGLLANSEGWQSIIKEAITNCSVYIPYISNGFFDSNNCCQEVQLFFENNKTADIILLLDEKLNVDSIIQKILTYDNILHKNVIDNMIKLFKASANLGKDKYSINQLYRYVKRPYFIHFANEQIFYQTFVNKKTNFINYKDFQEWNTLAMRKIGKE